ncbi:MAG TPA: DJ-1/PfpI family protein [Flavitalea sp.]|nr:DJ-1/PfpI family protein [Flavitalea sp.]
MKLFFASFFLSVVIAFPGIQANGQSAKVYYCPPCGSGCDTTAYNASGNCPHCGMGLLAGKAEDIKQRKATKKTKVLFYLQNGVEVLDFAGPMEVFSYAGFEVFTVSKTKDPIISQGILKILPEYSIEDAPAANIIAFFGGNSGNAANDSNVIKWLKKLPEPDYYFSVCTGAFVLGKAGLLDGLTITTFHESIDNLQEAVPSAKVVRNVRFVDNGNIITTAGISAGIDGALHLIAKLGGDAAAKEIAHYMEYDKWVPEEGLIIKK